MPPPNPYSLQSDLSRKSLMEFSTINSRSRLVSLVILLTFGYMHLGRRSPRMDAARIAMSQPLTSSLLRVAHRSCEFLGGLMASIFLSNCLADGRFAWLESQHAIIKPLSAS
mmetsp:Transcript_35895/g.70326  ORF Transcript_35895/g.70326 Transcript_35895/m.70326 type:complete len:112 (-) Transcript_35895:1471-1806(-)